MLFSSISLENYATNTPTLENCTKLLNDPFSQNPPRFPHIIIIFTHVTKCTFCVRLRLESLENSMILVYVGLLRNAVQQSTATHYRQKTARKLKLYSSGYC